MMSLGVLHAVNREAAENAAIKNIRPIELFSYDWAGDNPRPRIPHTGYLAPDDKRILARYFVDTSGWGRADEQAMTSDTFIQAARAIHDLASEHVHGGSIYWALVEQGQFQSHVEAYVPTRAWFDASGVVDDARCWAGADLVPLS